MAKQQAIESNLKWSSCCQMLGPVGLLIFVLLLGGCISKQTVEQTTAKLEPVQLGNTPNVHKYQQIFLAGQPSEADFEIVKQAGIKTVINLRMPAEMDFDEPQVVDRLGMSYRNPGIGSANTLTDQRFEEVRRLLNQTENHPILLHCRSANRVGAIWLAYRVLDGGVGYEAALAEAKRVGLKSSALEVRAKEYIQHHRQPK